MGTLVTWRIFVWLAVGLAILILMYPLIPPAARLPIPLTLYGQLLSIVLAAGFSGPLIVLFVIGFQGIATETFDGRAWGLSHLLMAVVFGAVFMPLFATWLEHEPGLTATGVMLSTFAGFLRFRRSEPMKYPRSRLWLWAQWIFTVMASTWLVAEAIRLNTLQRAILQH